MAKARRAVSCAGSLFLWLGVLAVGTHGQQPTRYTGLLSRDLAPTHTLGLERPLTPGTEADRKSLPVALSPGDQLFVGFLKIWSSKGLQLAFVRPERGQRYIYADTNGNGRFERSERHVLTSDPNDDADIEGSALLWHPLSSPRYSRYPIRIAILRSAAHPDVVTPASSMGMVFAEGAVKIEGRTVAVTYLFDTSTGKIDPDYGWIGVDCNGDGRIDRNPTSAEYQFAKHQVIVFHVGEHFVSTESVDVASGRIVLRVHPPASYTNVELALGKQIDTPFTDFAGQRRMLSEFRGKYVLLDFWATWCGPCVAEIPTLKAAYEKYRDRGFEIVGIDNDEDLAAAKQLVADRGVTWPQATLESTRGRLTVHAFPTTILLDREGKIVSMGSDNDLRGKNLEATLEKLLPVR